MNNKDISRHVMNKTIVSTAQSHGILTMTFDDESRIVLNGGDIAFYPAWVCPDCGFRCAANSFGGPGQYHDCKSIELPANMTDSQLRDLIKTVTASLAAIQESRAAWLEEQAKIEADIAKLRQSLKEKGLL